MERRAKNLKIICQILFAKEFCQKYAMAKKRKKKKKSENCCLEACNDLWPTFQKSSILL